MVELDPGLPGVCRASMRALCGKDEALIREGSHGEILVLLQQLLVENGPGTLAGTQLPDLAVCDVDRIVASLYLHYFGDPLESTVSCVDCGETFEVAFSLVEMQRSMQEARANGIAPTAGPDEHGVFELADGRRFRLPTMRDLAATVAPDPETAARRLRRECVLDGDPEQDPDKLDEAMAIVGPVLDTDLDATCPACETRQTVRFEMQRYFGQALAFEQQFLNQEVHQLARAYGWSRSEILAMPREDRRAHVRLVLAESATV